MRENREPPSGEIYRAAHEHRRAADRNRCRSAHDCGRRLPHARVRPPRLRVRAAALAQVDPRAAQRGPPTSAALVTRAAAVVPGARALAARRRCWGRWTSRMRLEYDVLCVVSRTSAPVFTGALQLADGDVGTQKLMLRRRASMGAPAASRVTAARSAPATVAPDGDDLGKLAGADLAELGLLGSARASSRHAALARTARRPAGARRLSRRSAPPAPPSTASTRTRPRRRDAAGSLEARLLRGELGRQPTRGVFGSADEVHALTPARGGAWPPAMPPAVAAARPPPPPGPRPRRRRRRARRRRARARRRARDFRAPECSGESEGVFAALKPYGFRVYTIAGGVYPKSRLMAHQTPRSSLPGWQRKKEWEALSV